MASTATKFDTDCKLMLHMDGADTSTTFTDSSSNPKTVNVTNNTQIDTGQSKFGGASALFDGADDDLNVADNADFNIDTQDFTIDFWVRFNTQTAESMMFRFLASNNLYLSANALAGRFDFNLAGTTKSYSTAATTATWYHIAVTRASGTVRFFFDGTQNSTDLTASGDVTQGEWRVGQFPATGIDLDGWIDEYRIVVGTAVWTTNFTPPTAAYTQAGGGARASRMMLMGIS